jgi:hypothetical protein
LALALSFLCERYLVSLKSCRIETNKYHLLWNVVPCEVSHHRSQGNPGRSFAWKTIDTSRDRGKRDLPKSLAVSDRKA